LPKFVHRKYASLVTIDVGILLQIAQQKKRKIIQTKIISDLPTLRERSLFMVGGWHRREMVFVAKILLTQPLKSKKIDYPTLNINLKINIHPWPKTLQTDTIQMSHMSFTTSVT
jgi:hypothetical protein